VKRPRPLNLPGSASEDEFHLSVARLLDWILIPPNVFYTTFPAGYGKLGKGMAGKLKAKGMKAGIPDILIFEKVPQPNRSHVIGLELKVAGRTASSAQRATHAALQAVGIRSYLCRDLEDVVSALTDAGIPHKPAILRSFAPAEVPHVREDQP
jgi:hypothetical protein